MRKNKPLIIRYNNDRKINSLLSICIYLLIQIVAANAAFADPVETRRQMIPNSASIDPAVTRRQMISADHTLEDRAANAAFIDPTVTRLKLESVDHADEVVVHWTVSNTENWDYIAIYENKPPHLYSDDKNYVEYFWMSSEGDGTHHKSLNKLADRYLSLWAGYYTYDYSVDDYRLVKKTKLPGANIPSHMNSQDNSYSFDKYTWLTTHNSFTNGWDASWIAGNQWNGIKRQLNDGVRGFMLDAYHIESDDRVYLLHGYKSRGQIPGITTPFLRTHWWTLSEYLQIVVDFLDSYNEEVVTIFLEDYITEDQLQGELNRVNGLASYLFKPDSPEWDVHSKGWPVLQEMIDRNKRLLIFTSRGRQEGRNQWNYTVENSYGDSDWDECVKRGESKSLDTQGYLFVMNHFHTFYVEHVLGASDSFYLNKSHRLGNRVTGPCKEAAGRIPNYISVDYYDTGDAQAIARSILQ